MKLKNLYTSLPAPLQDLACSAYGYRLNRRRYSGLYARLEREVCARECWPVEQLADFVDACLRRIVQHAATSVPYYRQLFGSLNIDYRDIRRVSDLAALPVLSKRT